MTIARQRLDSTELAVTVETSGRVEHVADGIARVSGLPEVGLGELLRFEHGQTGLVLTLDTERIGVVILDDAVDITAGSKVYGTGNVVTVPVGNALLGRVVDPLGHPLDDKEAVTAEAYHAAERAAPSIIERDLVTEPVDTGILVIDSLFSLGRGQRELIIGDRATGKTSIAVDTIINQRNSDIICVYVAIGQRATAVARVFEAIRSFGAPERCIFVVAGPSTSPGLQWLAPFTGMTMAEYFRDRGQHVLIVLDDLTRHAATHRELALLTDEPPGREAYPGDIFYLHARLLERAAKLSAKLGGGSLTALPIAETDAGNLSGYIPTNLISITDGQVVLNSHLFAASQRPAVDVGLSVSRVGGKAQHPAMKQVAGRVRLDYAQYLELEMFSRFGGISDEHLTSQIRRGERIRALLTQPRFSTLRNVDEIALLGALAEGVLDDLPVDQFDTLRIRIASQLDNRAASAVRVISENRLPGEEELRSLVTAVRDLKATLTAATAS
jgi:F-type H+-transporting ATPase subunit alpha